MTLSPSLRRLVGLVLAVAAVIILASGAARADGAVHLYYFYDPDCSVCEEVQRTVVAPLQEEYGDRLVVTKRNVAEAADFELLFMLELEYQVSRVSIPEVFIGQDALIGPEEITQRLAERVEHYLAQGGVALPSVEPLAPRTPVTTPAPPAVIHVGYFYQPGCDECDRAHKDLSFVLLRYPGAVLTEWNVKEAAAINQYLCTKLGVPAEKHLTAPALFAGDGYLLGDDIRGPNIEALLARYASTGAAPAWEGWEEAQSDVQQTIAERFRSFGILTIIGAGLLDGINPCAFATMVFLLSYLSVRKRQGRELLMTGAAFTLGVFLTYFLLGLGLLRFLAALPALNVIGKWVYGVTMVLCLGLAWGSVSDYFKARQGKLEDMSLKLPERLRGLIHRWIREGTSARNYVLSSFVLGMGVSVVELACTGQVYLPTIIFMLGLPEWRLRAGLALFLYNVMFILPLIAVFIAAYYGTTSKSLLGVMNRHAAAVKLGTAVLFLLLAAWLGYSIIA